MTETITEAKKLVEATQSAETHLHHKITDNVVLYIGDSLKMPLTDKFQMIYFDPPFNSDRDYKLNCDSSVGFSDKWSDADYEEFISKQICNLF